MAKLGISTGTNPNDGTGDTLLDGAFKVNSNFDEIYSSIGDGTNLTNSIGYATTAGIATYATTAGVATYASTAGIATLSQGISGTPNIVVGNVSSSGIVTSSGGFISTSTVSGRSVQINLSGSTLTFNVVGVGSTSFTLS